MRRINQNGVVFYRFKALEGEPGLEHAIFTRRGGVSQPPFDTLNMGHTVGDDLEAVRVNHQRALALLGWRQEDVTTCHLVHGARAALVGPGEQGRVYSETDALLSAAPGAVLMSRFGDCVPVLFYERRRRVIGLAHAGWRGVVNGVVPAAVSRLVEAWGCHPADLWAGVGPSIGPCCYEVGANVAQQIAAAVSGDGLFQTRDGQRPYLNLWAAVQRQLEQSGVGQVQVAELCTACNTADWFSHRAEGGKTGRFGVVIGLKRF